MDWPQNQIQLDAVTENLSSFTDFNIANGTDPGASTAARARRSLTNSWSCRRQDMPGLQIRPAIGRDLKRLRGVAERFRARMEAHVAMKRDTRRDGKLRGTYL